MVKNWLADADPATAWAHQAWTDFAALPQKEYAVVVLPVHALVRRQAGEPIDLEETRGGALLRRAIERVNSRFAVRVLPPLRFVPGTGPASVFGLDPETAHDLVAEIVADVNAAGFHKLVFFNTSPALEPFVAAAAVDARTGPGLRAYLVHARSLGFDAALDQSAELAARAGHLAALLTEIRGHLAPPPAAPAADSPAASAAGGPAFPDYRDRYLPALSAGRLAALAGTSRTLAIVPVGAIEQHGPHLPVGVDAILGQAMLGAALARVPPDLPVVVAPPITFGKSTEHRGYPGTVSLSTRTLRRLALAITGQVRDLGIGRVAFLNTHGGNRAVLAAILREPRAIVGVDAVVLRPGHAPGIAPQEDAWGFHAAEWETSLLLACAPELVHLDRAVAEYPVRLDDPGELRPGRSRATFAWMTRDLSRSGVIGDPTKATPEKGTRWLSIAAEALAARIAALQVGEDGWSGDGDLTFI